jgi:hypothetical protein
MRSKKCSVSIEIECYLAVFDVKSNMVAIARAENSTSVNTSALPILGLIRQLFTTPTVPSLNRKRRMDGDRPAARKNLRREENG